MLCRALFLCGKEYGGPVHRSDAYGRPARFPPDGALPGYGGVHNANTRRSVSSSDFRDGVLAIRLQKGIYSIKIGSGSTVEYIVKSTGESHMRQVTADARAALLRDAESVSVDLLWYENAVSGSAGADR